MPLCLGIGPLVLRTQTRSGYDGRGDRLLVLNDLGL